MFVLATLVIAITIVELLFSLIFFLPSSSLLLGSRAPPTADPAVSMGSQRAGTKAPDRSGRHDKCGDPRNQGFPMGSPSFPLRAPLKAPQGDIGSYSRGYLRLVWENYFGLWCSP